MGVHKNKNLFLKRRTLTNNNKGGKQDLLHTIKKLNLPVFLHHIKGKHARKVYNKFHIYVNVELRKKIAPAHLPLSETEKTNVIIEQ